MATATTKAHAARGVSEPASLAFRTYRDNGEHYHWEILDSEGAIIAQSGSFASQDDAERAAREVHERARSAPFESQVAEERHTVAA
ncbi:MAG: DUF1508 domain-containing protein [Solirubrobacteraceae bacterium]